MSNMWTSHPVPIKILLELIEQVKSANPKMMRIWKDSALAKEGRDNLINMTLNHEKELLDALANGATGDSCISAERI